MASDNYPIIDPHAPPHHGPTRHHQPLTDHDPADSGYYSHPFADGESDPEKSGSGGPTTPTTSSTGKRNLYYYNDNTNATKRHKLNGNENSGECASEYRVDYRKDREEWSDTAIACLLEAYTEKFNQLNRGNLRGRDWEEVAEAVSERSGGGCGGGDEKGRPQQQKTWKSVEQCKNKIDNLKKRYKVELQRMNSSNMATSHWHWFKKIEAIMGTSATNRAGESEDRGGVPTNSNAFRQVKRNMPANGFMNNLKSKSLQNLKWRRVVFKISGTALAGNCQNIDPKVAMQIAREVATACQHGVEVAIVVGGRNFFCGDSWVSVTDLDRPTAYQVGMMATVMNSILLQSAFEKLGVQTRLQSAFSLPEVAEPYSRQRAIRHLEKGRIVIFGGVGAGTGNPLFTTDTAAALRSSELNADAVLKGTNVNGIYDCHSSTGNIMLDHITFRELASRGITSIDMMAVTYCEDNGIPMVLFNLLEPGNISRALCGEPVGTLIDQTGRFS